MIRKIQNKSNCSKKPILKPIAMSTELLILPVLLVLIGGYIAFVALKYNKDAKEKKA